jgi:hypothetical protein
MFRRFILCFLVSSIFSQDIAGNYQFYGLYVIHQSFARYDTPIIVTDNYGLGLQLEVDELKAGEIYKTTYQGPYGHLYAAALNVVLNVNFNSDGTGLVAEGSYYPTEELDLDECTANIAILPITDELVYTSNLEANISIPGMNIIGSIPDGDHDHPSEGYNGGVLVHSGQSAGSISLSSSEYFDTFPSNPTQPTLCDGAGNCFDVYLEDGTMVAGGDPLPGFAGGYVLKGNLDSVAPNENTEGVDLYVEWHAIDGTLSGSGLGDNIGTDEDGDGTDFDRIWAMESLIATYLNPGPGCGYNYPIFGDVTAQLQAMGQGNCIDRVDIATEGYVFNESNGDWGNLVTYNSLTGSIADDSGYDYNNTDGRIVMHFNPICVQDINVRHMMLEFIEVGEGCPNLGDLNGDGGYNVLDIVALANCVLANNCSDLNNGCAGDLNGDGGYNVLDIVALANCVLANNCSDL